MRNYFIHNGQNELGPLNLEELKQQNLKPETPIWYEELESWTTANSIEELKTIFSIKTPPPLTEKNISTDIKTEKISLKPEYNTSAVSKEKTSYLKEIIIGSVIILVAIIIFASKNSTNSNPSYNSVGSTNIITDTTIANDENRQALQLQLQQTQIDEQNKRLAAQEKKEKARVAKEKQMRIDKRVEEINNDLATLYQNLEIEKENLNNVSAFHVLRSNSTRNEQINEAQSQIDYTKQRIDDLEKELRKLQPEMIED